MKQTPANLLSSYLGALGVLAVNLFFVGFVLAPASLRAEERTDLFRQAAAILEALGGRFIALNPFGPIRSGRTLALECGDLNFIAWATKHGVRGILVRPDRFIASQLSPSADISALNPFAIATAATLPQAA